MVFKNPVSSAKNKCPQICSRFSAVTPTSSTILPIFCAMAWAKDAPPFSVSAIVLDNSSLKAPPNALAACSPMTSQRDFFAKTALKILKADEAIEPS
jgi:hypothetical protein